MAFNPNDYNKDFDNLFGAGSFESGLNSARNAAKLKVQAGFAKKDYLSALKVKKKKAEKKTYDDAVDYWNDPANKEHLLGRGVTKTADDLLNDPRSKAALKEMGFNQSDFIDAMYNVSSGGEQLSKRGYKQEQKLEKDTVSQEKLPLIPMVTKKKKGKKDKVSTQLKKKEATKKKDEPFLTDVKNFFTGKDTDGDGQRNGLLGALDRYVQPISQGATEFLAPGNNERMIQNDIQKHGKITNPVNKASLVDRGTETKVLHGAGAMMAALSPYGRSYKAVDYGFNLLPKLSKAVTNPYAQKAIKGAFAGGMAEGGISAENELFNSEAHDMGDYAKRTAWGVAGGAIGDPILHKLGNMISKAASRYKGSNNAEVLGLPEPQKALPAPKGNTPERYPSNYNYEEYGFKGESADTPQWLREFNKMNDEQVPGLPEPQRALPEPQRRLQEPQIRKPMDDFVSNESPIVHVPKELNETLNKFPTKEEFVDQELAPYRETAQQQADARDTWDIIVKEAKEKAQQIKSYYGRIVPDGLSKDAINEIPPQFRDGKSGKGNDIYSFAEEEGFANADEAIAYLKQIDEDSKLKLKDLMPKDDYVLSADEWDMLEQTARQKYLETHGGNPKEFDETLNFIGNDVKQQKKTNTHSEQAKNQPKSKTKTQIDDALRSLDINDAYLTSSRRDKKITDEEYFRKAQENEAKRQALTEQGKAYSHDVPKKLKTTWNNETRSFELGDYSAKQAYGGGLTVKKGGETVGKFRTEEEAKRFMQESVAKEQGIELSFDKDGVLNWKSTQNESGNWDIQAGEYSIHKNSKDSWTVKKGEEVVGTFKSEKKAREMAQRHYDKQPKADEQTAALEQKLNELSQQRKTVVTPPKTQPKAPPEAQKTKEVPKQEGTAKGKETPKKESKKPNERSFYNTVQNPEKLSPELKQRLDEYDKTYTPMSNEEAVKFANEYVKNDMEKAYQFVKNAKKFDPRHITVGHRLIDELQKAGEFNKALDVVERLAEQGTKAGQSIQSYSIYNRLSAEGQLLRAQRHVNKINQDIADPAKQVKLTPQHVEDISQTADSIQKFAGQMDQANNVMKIMENVKKGKIATDSELETVRSFVSDAKKFFGDLDPNLKEPKVKPVKDVRTRDKVVDFMDKKEDIARQELKKIFGRANSLPVDAFYHLSTIGASKIAKGTVKLADFTEEMVKDFGEMVRPYAKQIYNKAVETFNLQSESMTRQRLSEVEKITNKALKGKTIDASEAESIREFARQVGQMSGDAKLEHSMELQTVLQSLERPTFGQKLSAAQTIAQLLNPKTIVRNAIGNEMFYRVEQMNKLLATPVDIVRSKITGGERTITFKANNQGQYWRNWLTGAKAGWKGVNPMGLTTAYDIGPQSFRSKFNPLTYLEKSLGATLRSFDHAGYMRAYNKTLGELSTLRAVNEGLTGQAKKEAIARYIREADANMVQIADQYGKYATFQDSTALSTALTKVKKGMNKVSTFGATEDFGLGDLVLKYPKTPGNLVMRALEYSPVGLVRSANILKAAYKTKDPLKTKEGTLAITRAIIGTSGFSLLGYVLADKGILTSAGNSDYEVASLERNAGKQSNSVNVSALGRFLQSGLNLKAAGTKEGDTFVSYDWAQPISIAIALGTGINQSVKENGKLDVGGAIKGGADSAANTIINQSVLKGLNDFLANYPGRTMSDRVGDAAKGIAGSFVPTLSNQIRQVGDNTSRSTYSPSLLPEIKNRAVNRVPGLQKQLPPAYDTLGNKKETYQNKGNNLFNVFLNPSFVSKYKPSPEAKFVLDIIKDTGDKSLAPRIAQKKLDGKPLTSKQYSKMQRIMGEEVKKGLTGMTRSTNDEDTRKAIEKVLREAGKTAREAIRAERGE